MSLFSKRTKCEHVKTELILKNWNHEPVPYKEREIDLYYIVVGVRCLDCNDKMPTPEIVLAPM